MDLHQKVTVASSWNVQGPYDINCILQCQCEDESSQRETSVMHSIKLAPPASTANDDDNSPPCQLVLTCLPGTAVTSVEVISNARHVELYDSLDSYCCTVRGQRHEVDEGEGDHSTGSVMYLARLNVENVSHRCRLKFVSLTDKCQLTLNQVMVTTTGTESESHTLSVGGVGGRGIDMVKVREIMASLEQPIPSNVQSLMQTVEQYQKNQASVLDDLQQAATSQLSASTTTDPKASLASNMAGMLSAFSKASAYQQAASRATRRSHAAAPSEAAELSNQSHTSVDNEGDSKVSDSPSQQFNVDSLTKLLASLGGRRPQEGGENTETHGCDGAGGMLNALRTMCRDVSNMRAADRQAAERSYGPDRQERDANSEITRQTEKPLLNNGMVELEKRLMGYVVATEERIMGRLDRQIELLRDHIDLRFNKLEAMLQVAEIPAKRDGLIPEELD